MAELTRPVVSHEAGAPAPRTPAAAEAAADEAQVVTDEEQARLAREQYRESGIPTIDADDGVAEHLARDERVLGSRQVASLARVDDTSHGTVRDDGPLYVTNQRLLHIGSRLTAVPLDDIAELAMADDRILVTIAGGRGLMLDVSEPRQFRVLLAAARTAERA